MAPEQARGKAVDRRADLWALGCVLYEMLTAKPAFAGETITDILSAVISKESDWPQLSTDTPPAVQRLLRRCLRKDARMRVQSAGDVRVELDDALSTPEGEPTAIAGSRPAGSGRGPWMLALSSAAAGAVLATAGTLFLQPRAPASGDAPAMRYTIELPATLSAPGAPAISPDGRWLVIAARGSTGGQALWLRPMDGQTFPVIAGSEQGSNPIWSPDSRELAFFTRGSLNRIPVTGGAPTRVTTDGRQTIGTSSTGVVASWGLDGTILLGSTDRIYRVPVSGGTVTPVTTVEARDGETANITHSSPWWLPDNCFLFTENMFGMLGTGGGLLMQPLAGGAPTRLMNGRALARYTPQGLLVARFTSSSVATLSAHRFDAERGTLEQPGVVLAGDVSPTFSASHNGVIAYRQMSSGADHRFVWVDAKGQPIGDSFDCRDRIHSTYRATSGCSRSWRAATSCFATSLGA